MVINSDFYLNGFTRLDKGEAGAVFVHYGDDPEQKAPRAPIVRYGYTNAREANFSITLPLPAPRTATACAIVTRSSKNCYTATVYDVKRIATFRESSLNELRRVVAGFFKEVEA